VVINVLEGQEDGVMPPPPKASPLPPVPQDFMMRLTASLRGSRRPLLLAGGGCIRDAQAVRALVQGVGLPAVTTAPGRGVVDEADPLCLGPAGTIGREEANRALCNCDLLLALGSRLSHNVLQPLRSSEGHPRIFQVAGPGDRSPLVEPTSFYACTMSSVLQGLTRADGLSSGNEWFRKSEPSPEASGGARISPVLAEALAVADEESVLVMDAGTVGLAVYRNFQARKPNHLLYQWGIATMGSSLAAAVGACCSGQKRAVVVAGDAGLLMGSAELSTVAELSLPVKIFVFNNGGMQFIRGIQAKEIGKEVDASFGPVDFVALARVYGIRAARVKEDETLTPELRGALEDARPLLLDVEYGRDEADLKGTQWERKQ
jgi:acetolactate synthase-1/2/3 large subunit